MLLRKRESPVVCLANKAGSTHSFSCSSKRQTGMGSVSYRRSSFTYLPPELFLFRTLLLQSSHDGVQLRRERREMVDVKRTGGGNQL